MFATMERGTKVTAMPEDETGVGARLQERRMALGLTRKALADKAGVDRGRLSLIEKGASFHDATVGAIERTLTQLEEEMGGPYDRHGQVTFRMAGNFGVDVVVQGPVENLSELEASVARLLREMRENGD